MPRLSRNQQQAIGRLGAGHSALIVANAYNVNTRTIYCLQHRYNTTNDGPCCGRPESPQQLRRLVKTWNTATTHQCRHHLSPLGLQQCSLSTSCLRSYSYNYNGLQIVNIGTISIGEDSSSHMKVGFVFRLQIADYGSGKEY